MNLFGLSPGELLLILMVAMVVLGPEKIPEVAASLGKWIREFRRATEELTAQFAGENPLYELQRALSLTDEPAAPVVETASAPALPQLSPATESVATTPPTSPAAPVRSSYFLYPPVSPGVADDWVHGSLGDEFVGGRRITSVLLDPLEDDWTHGVPVTVPLVSDLTEVGANGHAVVPTEEETTADAPGTGATDERLQTEQTMAVAVDVDGRAAPTEGEVVVVETLTVSNPPESEGDAVGHPPTDDQGAEIVPAVESTLGEIGTNGRATHSPEPGDRTPVSVTARDGREGERT